MLYYALKLFCTIPNTNVPKYVLYFTACCSVQYYASSRYTMGHVHSSYTSRDSVFSYSYVFTEIRGVRVKQLEFVTQHVVCLTADTTGRRSRIHCK